LNCPLKLLLVLSPVSLPLELGHLNKMAMTVLFQFSDSRIVRSPIPTLF
jgi:hypothetical protein